MESTSEWDKRRYVPQKGDPALPPQLADYSSKTTEEVMKDINRLPLFMTQLDETDGEGGENEGLEALKALAYEGEPDEVASNFKNQGNDCYKSKQYQDAVQYYTKALEVKCDDAAINASLYLNRAACNLELKNYRRCINDCKLALLLTPDNVKAYYRSAKAYLALGNLNEASELVDFVLKQQQEHEVKQDTKALEMLGTQIRNQKQKLEEQERKRNERENAKKAKEAALAVALTLRGYTIVHTKEPFGILQNKKIFLETETDVESQMIFPGMVLYPTLDEWDFVEQISELNTPKEIIGMLMDRPPEYFAQPGHENFQPKNLQAYMQTQSGGLVKVGRNLSFKEILSSKQPIIPLMDNSLRVYVVPKQDGDFLSQWNKAKALSERM
ncbi:BA75_02708T0 [Komagataella pastoris]|uniref:BA75_02708T0 n=1 Tax=Komagataella pastoris TaxID=4922 RepID=A0A1B2JD19_PICPA|nr:BA75_02708T0 [Komagataella pastoris]